MAKNARPEQYRGPLTAAQIADGMNAAVRNARRLVEDAETMLAASRWPSATALAILSIEESGKVSVLREIAVADTQERLKDAWRSYRSHQRKNFTWLLTDFVKKGARTLDDLAPLADPESDHPVVLDSVKQIAIYTDCYGQRHWSEPHAVADEQLARSLTSIARVHIGRGPHSAREVELWCAHMGPVWRTPMMVVGLRQYFQAISDEGLAVLDTDSWKRFLSEGRHRQR